MGISRFSTFKHQNISFYVPRKFELLFFFVVETCYRIFFSSLRRPKYSVVPLPIFVTLESFRRCSKHRKSVDDLRGSRTPGGVLSSESFPPRRESLWSQNGALWDSQCCSRARAGNVEPGRGGVGWM